MLNIDSNDEDKTVSMQQSYFILKPILPTHQNQLDGIF